MIEYNFKSDAVLREGTYIENKELDAERIDAYMKAGGPKSEFYNTAVVWAYGNSSQWGAKNYPLLFETQGKGRKKGYQTLGDNEIKNNLLGNPKQTSTIAKTIYGDNEKVGNQHSEFYLFFKDNHFTKGETIYKGTPIKNWQIQLLTAGEKEGPMFKFKCRIMGATSSYIPAYLLKANEIWADGPYKVSNEHSRGNENRSYTPYQVKNSLSKMRQSMNVAGNTARKYMGFTITLDGKSFNMAYDWEKHQTKTAFMAVQESDLIMSKSTKDVYGFIHNYDVNSGKAIMSGEGIIGQIPKCNILSYNTMNTATLDNWLTDVMSIANNLQTGSNAVIEIMAGWDLLQSVSKSLGTTLKERNVTSESDLYVKKGENGLRLGGYFTEYEHMSGTVFKFVHHSFFDNSGLAKTSGTNPETGRSLMSSEGIIMNFGKVTYTDNKGNSREASNIEYMFEEGLEYSEGMVRGMAYIEGKQAGDNMATDQDASSLHMMVTQGVHCYTPLSLGYIQYNYRAA